MCYNEFDNTCIPKGHSFPFCPSNYNRMCGAAGGNELGGANPYGGGCYDQKNPKKCVKKSRPNRKGLSKCRKPKVARICRKTCGLCGGVPPPPAPPPLVG